MDYRDYENNFFCGEVQDIISYLEESTEKDKNRMLQALEDGEFLASYFKDRKLSGGITGQDIVESAYNQIKSGD